MVFEPGRSMLYTSMRLFDYHGLIRSLQLDVIKLLRCIGEYFHLQPPTVPKTRHKVLYPGAMCDPPNEVRHWRRFWLRTTRPIGLKWRIRKSTLRHKKHRRHFSCNLSKRCPISVTFRTLQNYFSDGPVKTPYYAFCMMPRILIACLSKVFDYLLYK